MQMQQQISFANVLGSIPPDKYPGHRLNLVPMITQMVENIFGPRLAPLIFEDEKAQMTIPPDVENEWMVDCNLNLAIHPLDDNMQHFKEHAKPLQATRYPLCTLRQPM